MFVITGATGNVGRPLVERLVAEGAGVVAVSRTPSAAAFPPEVEVIEPDAMTTALRGATGLFVNSRAVRSVEELVALAGTQGVRRVVGLAAINVDDDPARQPSRYNGDRNKEVDDTVGRSGLEWVSLRPTTFTTNTIRLWGDQIRAGDVVRGPYARFADAPIDPVDVAAVAARAFLSDDLLGQRPVLTGPVSLTQAELVAVIGQVLGRSLRYQEIPADAVRNGMADRGFPPGFVDALLARFAAGMGQPAVVTNDVPKILGRPARTFADWVADHKPAFGE